MIIYTSICFIEGMRSYIMQTANVRLNIILPKDVAESLEEIAGPRNRSRLIS